MAQGGSTLAVVAAIGGNFLVMTAKLVGFALTGSGALLSEGIHSLADVLNQLLLYVGIRRSDRGPDASHPYGYGAERYVWALMSAVGIFFLGCGVTVYHGVESLLHPKPLGDLGLAIGILVFAFVIEAIVFWVAYRQLKRASEGQPFLEYLRTEADPAATAVLLEDAAACLGVLIALAAIGLTKATGNLYWDAVGSITIGLLLGAVAIFLIMRNRTSLVGEAIPERKRKKIFEVLRKNPVVGRVVLLRGRVLDPATYDIQTEVEFDGEAIARKLEKNLREAYPGIKSYADFQAFAASYAKDVTNLLGDEVDALEREIRREVPRAEHVDIETD